MEESPSKFSLKNYLSEDCIDLVENLHKVAPIHRKKVEQLLGLIERLGQEYKHNKTFFDEIFKIHIKIKNFLNKKMIYNEYDTGPFMVIIENKNQSNKGLHPMDMGKYLHKLGVKCKSIVKKGSNKIGITCFSLLKANNLIYNVQLDNDGFKCYVPQSLITSKGIVRDIGFSISEEDIIKEAKSRVNIIEARRLNRKVVEGDITKYVPTKTVLLTFAGKRRPDEISIFSCITKVMPYLSPTIQCKKCLRFGHKASICKSTVRCPKCGAGHNLNECSEETSCLYCKGPHLATDQKCKEFDRQKKINEIMAFHEISYYEASKICPPLIQKPSNNNFTRSAQDFPSLRPTGEQKSTMFWQESQQKFYEPLKKTQDTISPKRKKITLVDKITVDEEEVRRMSFPQPTRMPSPNGNVLQQLMGTQNVDKNTPETSPSPAFSPLSEESRYRDTISSNTPSSLQSDKIEMDNTSTQYSRKDPNKITHPSQRTPLGKERRK